MWELFPQVVEANGVQSLQIRIPTAVLLGAIPTTMPNESVRIKWKEIQNGELQSLKALHTEWNHWIQVLNLSIINPDFLLSS